MSDDATTPAAAPRPGRFYAAVLFQFLLLFGLLLAKQATLWAGQTVTLETVPVDPRDLFRGDYVILRYAISTVEPWQIRATGPAAGRPFARGDAVYVSLRREGRFWVADGVSATPPTDGRLFLRGRVRDARRATTPPDRSPGDAASADESLEVEYGIESYFVPEGKGRDLERARDDKTTVLVVEAAVDRRGAAVLRRVYAEPRR